MHEVGRSRSGRVYVGRPQVAREILDYLRKNPEAQDTAVGIAEWWLPDQKIKSRLITIKAALAELVARGFILRHMGQDSQVHYRINVRRLRQIETVLSQQRV